MAAMTQTIPLFPLDVVLFPGMSMPLHIFEMRYRKMVRDCLVHGEPFGIIWAESEPVSVPTDRPLVGTRAPMTEVVPLADGRFNINTVGSERFLVTGLSHEEPYLVGTVEPFPTTGVESSAARRQLPYLLQLFESYLDLLSRASGQEVILDPFPSDPLTLAYAVGILYQGQNWRKQALLACQHLPELLAAEIELLRLENPLIEQSLLLRDAGALSPLISGTLASYGLN